MSEIEVIIEKRNGVPTVSSRVIAKGLEKDHEHVLNKIKEILDRSEFWPT